MRSLSLFIVLFIFWLLLSGIYNVFLISAGSVIAALTVWFAKRMEVIDHEGHPIGHAFSVIFLYWPWLLKEICVSALKVSKLILSPSLPISPKMDSVNLSQKTDLGRTIFANSITLTPGTIAVEINKETILVHALENQSLEDLKKGDMDKRVTHLE